ncbi:MAG: zinc-regulated TonB-dependent outer membrane receptor [Pseudomonadota bacterium]
MKHRLLLPIMIAGVSLPIGTMAQDNGTGASQGVLTGTNFNPAISVIPDFVYGNFSREPSEPAGFGHGDEGHDDAHGGDHGHGVGEGFQLREAELALSGSVDPYMELMVTAGIGEDSIELEEAYAKTTALPAGLQIKAGKFLSDTTYINSKHIHDWDFVDQPWMREFLFSGHGLNEKGVQLSWVAPTTTYTRLGVEALEGETEGIASYQANEEFGLDESPGPRLFTAFAKIGPDLGYDHALQFGLSGGFTEEFRQVEEHDAEVEALQGKTWFAGVDTVYKYNGQGPSGEGNLTLQAEYLVRARDLKLQEFEPHDGHFDPVGSPVTLRPRQDGAYVQGVYGFAPRWDAGLRMDALGMTNKVFEGAEREEAGTSFRYSGQVSFAPSEFSRLRAQLSLVDADTGHSDAGGHGHDHGAGAGGHTGESWQFMLQYNLSLGAHGAHSF